MTRNPYVSANAWAFERLMAVLEVSVKSLRRTALDDFPLQVPVEDGARVCFCEEGVALVRAGDRPVIHLQAGGLVLVPAGLRLGVRSTHVIRDEPADDTT